MAAFCLALLNWVLPTEADKRVAPAIQHATVLEVTIEGIRAPEGLIHLGFYKSAEKWASEKSDFQRHCNKTALTAEKIVYTFSDVAPGHYAIAVVDDENSSGGMDWGILLPKEGFGFSNYEHQGFRRPKYDDFDFELVAGRKTEIKIKLRYL